MNSRTVGLLQAPWNNGRVRRVVLLLALWGAATAFGLTFAALTAVGPVLLTLTPRHGVHEGDLVVFAAAYTTAAVLTWRLPVGA